MKKLEEAMSAYSNRLHRQTGRWLATHGVNIYDRVGKDLLTGLEEAFGMAFKDGAEWQKKQSPWVSVKEKLPETYSVYGNTSESVLVFLKEYGFDAIGHFCSDGKWIAEFTKDGVHASRPVKVDYWMPIPSIPKGGLNG